ncbi:MAG: sulfotransferase [Acidimicrobiia bacterium]|nr:sulfotransferase [Acidimicrobiia bacterium]MYG58804.1 sulfotransferase [Acidimicrobiia bacterium]MYJ33528.1 sulfotransferase [Acidimicrobiia bacterium]
MTSTDYQNPYRPVPVRVFNRLGRAGSSGRLDVDKLTKHAKRKTGLSDFGDDGHLEALQVLVESINNEARLTPTGRIVQKSRLAGALIQRLRIQDLLRRHPEIDDIDLGPVIAITGLQRTGTTLLHRLLYSHPEIRGISGLEALMPVAATDSAERAERARKRRAMLAERTISYLSPDFMAVHPVDREQPEEDVLLLDLNFMSQSAEAILHVPSYSRWLQDQDHTATYEYFRRVLKVLTWQQPATAWVIKTPHHLEYLDVLLKVFEGATVVQTHRDPRVAVSSFCSMVAHGRGMFSDNVDPAEIGRHWCDKTHRMVEWAMKTRAETPEGRFVDVSYYDLIRDPMTQLRRIFEVAAVEFDDEAKKLAEQYAAANPQNRFGKHNYRLEHFGLSQQAMDETFAAYREAYDIPFE